MKHKWFIHKIWSFAVLSLKNTHPCALLFWGTDIYGLKNVFGLKNCAWYVKCKMPFMSVMIGSEDLAVCFSRRVSVKIENEPCIFAVEEWDWLQEVQVLNSLLQCISLFICVLPLDKSVELFSCFRLLRCNWEVMNKVYKFIFFPLLRTFLRSAGTAGREVRILNCLSKKSWDARQWTLV